MLVSQERGVMLNLRCASSLCVHTIQNNFSMGHFHMSVIQQHFTVWKKVSSSHFLCFSWKGVIFKCTSSLFMVPQYGRHRKRWSPLLKCTSSLFMVPQCSRHRKRWSPLLKCTSSLFMIPQCSRHRKWWSALLRTQTCQRSCLYITVQVLPTTSSFLLASTFLVHPMSFISNLLPVFFFFFLCACK